VCKSCKGTGKRLTDTGQAIAAVVEHLRASSGRVEYTSNQKK
jgi:hypothetical protein